MSNEEYRKKELVGMTIVLLTLLGFIAIGYLIITGSFSPTPTFEDKQKVCIIGLPAEDVFIRHTHCSPFSEECSYKVLFSQGGSVKMYDSELEICEEK